MNGARVLLIDDDKNLLRVMSYHLEESGALVSPFDSPEEALRQLPDKNPDVVITDLRMPEMDGLEVLSRIRDRYRELPVIVLTAHGSIDKAVEAVKSGAFDFLTKPFEKAEIEHAINRALRVRALLEENRRLSQAVREKFEFQGIIGSSKKFREVLDKASRLAEVDTTVLLQGQSGTGKELLAQAIHFNSPRKNCPLVVVNCGAIPADLMESELFGHKKGAFTGAIAEKKGKFEIGDSGTIFLDEVGELPLTLQVKLLRVLQEKEIDVVGDPRPKPVDVRIIAATNRDLRVRMEEGLFREDLYYRLAVAPLLIPPLRERREDIPLLVHHALGRLTKRLGKEVRFDEPALEAMQQYAWPGNVRELENVVERTVVFARKEQVSARDLPAHVREATSTLGEVRIQLPEEGFSLEELERDILLAALEKHDWNQSSAARYLGITRNTLVYRMNKFNLRAADGG